MALRILRIALYIQFLLGLVRFFGPRIGFSLDNRVWDTHVTLAIVITLLALYALRPLPDVPSSGVRVAARFAPLVPLLVGIGFLTGVIPTGALVVVHMLLGVLTIALVEMASGQERRALRGRERLALPSSGG